ncbi:MAG: acyl-CoA dehydrogenase C-terminal domain-containing protein [Gammaproteobacteria bacterium]
MATYQAPLRDMRFVLNELLAEERAKPLPGCEEFTPDLIDAVLGEAAKFCETVLQPTNEAGDREGCKYENGVVRTPSGFKDAYQTYVDGGWPGLAADPQYGGQGLPEAVAIQISEMLCSANLAFALYPGLSHGAYRALAEYGTDEQKSTFLPPIVEGRWSGTMCLTEPQCGTDLGMVRTKAVPNDDGSYSISGSKIFITGGEHDLTENIIHLVLARTPNAPEGIRGISLFIVPKFKVKEDGAIGPRNGVMCAGIEKKMGIHGSSTSQLNFDDAVGYLVGQENKGMRAMFVMMNGARLAVAISGAAVGETAYQNALNYAHEREQGRALTGPASPDRKADPILVHPDIRHKLLAMRAYIEGCRGLASLVAVKLDEAERLEDRQARQSADDFVALMTPIVKAMFTDLGSEIAHDAVQIYGGHGYIKDHGMEQFIRDVRITQIYEGTNAVQALDLVGRKLPAHVGRYLRSFFHPVSEFIEARHNHPELKPMIMALAKAFGRLQQATGLIAQKGLKNPNEAGSASVAYLRLFGLVALGWVWARSAEVALGKAGDANGEAGFYRAKLDTARYFFEHLLPQTGSLFASIAVGGDSVMNASDEAFTRH